MAVDFTVVVFSSTATIQSQSDLSFTSSGTMTGTAWLTTADGSIDISATDINISGLTQVLNAPFDGFSTDVSITASNGSVSLGQGVRAVNKIVIDQQSTTGSVQSNGIVSAYDVQVFSEGDVDIDTSASFVDVSVASTLNGAANTARTVTVDSDRDSRFRISTAGGTANVSALGVDNDNGTPGDITDDIAALSLELRETAVLSATAPQGRIDVIAVTSDELVMGVAADLLQGNATNMQAAGSVEIRTTQSPVTVLDAAVAGRGQLQVRAAATGNLAGTYSQNTPGITPSTITAAAMAVSTVLPLASFGGLDGTTNPLRFRDLVLLSNQTNAEENGVYQVSVLGMNQHHGSYVDMDLPRQRASCPLELVSISQMVMNEVIHIGSMSMPMSSTSHHFVSHRELHGQQMKLLCDLQQRRSSLVRSIMPQVGFLELGLIRLL